MKGISYEKISEGVHRVLLDYDDLNLSGEYRKLLKTVLEGKFGLDAESCIEGSVIMNRRCNITQLDFETEKAARNLVKALEGKIESFKLEEQAEKKGSNYIISKSVLEVKTVNADRFKIVEAEYTYYQPSKEALAREQLIFNAPYLFPENSADFLWGAIPPQNPKFAGRVKELEQLKESLQFPISSDPKCI